MDQLAIRHAAPELVPLATCGTALTDHHLDLLAQHTDLATLTLGFDADTAGRNAALSAGRKLTARGIDALDIDLFTPPPDSDPAEVLAENGPDQLRSTLTDPEHHDTLLGLLVQQRLDSYLTYDRPLRELPIREHAAYDATRLVGDHLPIDRADTEHTGAMIQHELARIVERTGVDPGELSHYLLDYLIDDDYEFEVGVDLVGPADVVTAGGLDDEPDPTRLETTAEQHLEHPMQMDFELP